jgi:hypothetical protein
MVMVGWARLAGNGDGRQGLVMVVMVGWACDGGNGDGRGGKGVVMVGL